MTPIEIHSKVIAEFMGAESIKNSDTYQFKIAPTPVSSYRWDLWAMQYHTSWDWLHPVWVKFSQMSFKKNIWAKMVLLKKDIEYLILTEEAPLKAFEAIANASKLTN